MTDEITDDGIETGESYKDICENFEEGLELANTLVEIQAVTGASDSDVEGLAESVGRISSHSEYSPTDVAEVAFRLTRRGYDVDELEEPTETVVRFSSLKAMSLEMGTETVADVLAIHER